MPVRIPFLKPNRSLTLSRKMPVTTISGGPLPSEIQRRLTGAGICSALQLKELVDLHPRRATKLCNLPVGQLRQMIVEGYGDIPDFRTPAMQNTTPLPVPGIAGALPASAQAPAISVQGQTIEQYLDQMHDFPTSVTLTNQMQPVSSQGSYPYCVSFATNATLEFVWQKDYSETYLHTGARSEPDFPPDAGPGSWLYFALKHAYGTGHVRGADYTFEDCVAQKSIIPLRMIARKNRALGFTSLLHGLQDPAYLPKLFRAILSGQFSDQIGPHPIPVSLMLYESFHSYATATQGQVKLPDPSETRVGGHAMTIVGFIDAADPANPYGVNYFLVRNSWGQNWAAENPFGHPGHALIPEGYFTPKNTVEAYLCLA